MGARPRLPVTRDDFNASISSRSSSVRPLLSLDPRSTARVRRERAEVARGRSEVRLDAALHCIELQTRAIEFVATIRSEASLRSFVAKFNASRGSFLLLLFFFFLIVRGGEIGMQRASLGRE